MKPIPFPSPFGTSAEGKNLEEARGEIVVLQEVVAELERRLETQAVLLRAVFALLNERHGFTEAELLGRFWEVEAERAGAPPKRCSRCGRGVNLRHLRCLYCNEACQVESAFDLLKMGVWPNLSSQPNGQELKLPDKEGITTRPIFY